jgi:hypothetical protein
MEIAMAAPEDRQPLEKTGREPDKSSPPEVPLHLLLALTLTQCCALSALKIYRLREAIWSGELAFIQQGSRGQYLIRREALEKFLREQERRESR